jgi:hypothetical protein
MSRNSNQSSSGISYTGLGMAIGLVAGGSVGLVLDNMVVFAGFGMVLGLAVGYALARRGSS